MKLTAIQIAQVKALPFIETVVVPPTRGARTVDEWVLIAEERAKKNGSLENPKWLIKNGLYGLYQAMRLHPRKFAHIKQDKKIKTVDEWIRIAELRAKKNGSLENPMWLIKNGFAGLLRSMLRHPAKFSHIKQDKKIKFKSTAEWLKVAKGLAKKNKGVLQNSRWLQTHGYSGLDQRMRKYPRAFKGIEQLFLDKGGNPR